MPAISATRSVAPLRQSLEAIQLALVSKAYANTSTSSQALSTLLLAGSPVFARDLGGLVDAGLTGGVAGHNFKNQFFAVPEMPALDIAVSRWAKFKGVDGHAVFIKELLPFIAQQAGRFHVDGEGGAILSVMVETVGADLPADSPKRTRRFTKMQLLCLLANAFLCTYRRVSSNCASIKWMCNGEDEDGNISIYAAEDRMPSCNYDELLTGPEDLVHISKIEMILCYFYTMMLRVNNNVKNNSNGSTLEREEDEEGGAVAGQHGTTLIIGRGKASPVIRLDNSTTTNTTSTSGVGDYHRQPLLPVTIHPLRRSIDDQRDAIRVDFANKIIGGAVSYGNVQEEITFALCPELHVSRIMFAQMAADEAIVLVGAEQFSLLKVGTYGGNMECAGFPSDPSAEMVSSRTSVIVAVDALDFRSSRAVPQFSTGGFEREINKLSAGLQLPIQSFVSRLQQDGPPSKITTTISKSGSTTTTTASSSSPPIVFNSSIVATGNWGCGVFRGDVMLKTILQWITCCIHGKEMHYYPFDREDVFELGNLMNALVEKNANNAGDAIMNVGDLVKFLRVVEDRVGGGDVGTGGGKRGRGEVPLSAVAAAPRQQVSRRFVLELFASYFGLKVVSSSNTAKMRS